MKNFKLLSVFLIICIPFYFYGQQSETSDSSSQVKLEKKRVSLIAVPLVFYLPETRLGFGGASNISLHWKGQDRSERPTQFTAGVAYTLNKQLLTYISYNIYLPGETVWLRGEVGYYDYVYQFFGTGQNRAPEEANFFSRYPRLKIDALRQVYDNIFFGLSYRFDDYQITSVEDPESLFDEVSLDGGITSGLGVAGVVDTRDIINYPSKGLLFELTIQANHEAIGATYEYVSVLTSFSKYLPIKKNVLALNFNSTNIFGTAPFYELALFGGGKRSRGYIEGEYRANNSFAVQAEYRIRFQNKLNRFGAVFFASIGQVFDDVDELQFENALPAVGGGIRYLLSKEQNLNLRADAGFGINGLQFYVTFAEAF